MKHSSQAPRNPLYGKFDELVKAVITPVSTRRTKRMFRQSHGPASDVRSQPQRHPQGDYDEQAMAHLETEIAFFKARQSELAQDHHGKFVVIIGESVTGYYDSELEAYMDARKKAGSRMFLIRKCVPPEQETRHMFRSRVA